MHEMKRKSLLFVLPIIALALMSCQLTSALDRRVIQESGKVKTEQRQVSDVERVSLEGMGDLTVIQGKDESLSVEADENVLPYIETIMRGRELVLRLKDGYEYPHTNIKYTLKIKSLNQVSISGAGNLTSEKLNVG